MRVLLDQAPADWLTPRFGRWGTVGSTVPTGFDAYARVLHTPADGLTWAAVAAARGTVLHPAAQWYPLARVPLHARLELDGLSPQPEEGRLAPESLARVIRAIRGSGPVTAAVWTGWGDLQPVSGSRFAAFTVDATPADRAAHYREIDAERTASVSEEVASAVSRGPWLRHHGGRDYLLLVGDAAEFADPEWVWNAGIGWTRTFGSGPSPSLLWPDDRSWCLATEIDFDSTLVGGDRATVDAILAAPELEAVEVDADTDLTYRGDTVNPTVEP